MEKDYKNFVYAQKMCFIEYVVRQGILAPCIFLLTPSNTYNFEPNFKQFNAANSQIVG
jgi:hypothetical protein